MTILRICSVPPLRTGASGPCDQYLEAAGASRSVLGELRTDYRLLVVPGIFGQCIDPLAKAFADASAHLEHTHGIKTDYVSVSATGGTAFNVAQIAEYLKKHFTSGVGPYYVAFGYSKGASDLLAALGRYPVVQEAVKGFVSVAGTVSGSRLADGVPDNILEFLAGDTFGPCDFGDGEGINSLRRQPRIEALLRTTLPSSLRTYSVTATSTWETTSRVLQNGWRTLSAISEFPKWRKYLISLSFRGQSSVRPVQVGGFDVNIVIHRSTAVRGRGGPARHDAWPPSLGAILAHTDGPCGS